MRKQVTNNEILAAIMAQTEAIKSLTEALQPKQPETSVKKSVSKSAKSSKTSQKKSQTWEEHLTETFGDKDSRSKFVELRNKVRDEFKTLAESSEKYIPKRMYKQVLNSTTENLNGKFSKAKVKEAFLAVAK